MSVKEITAQSTRETSSVKQEQLGARATTPDGREYVYVKNGAAALDPGKVVANADEVANHVNIAVNAAAAAGDTRVQVTLGATAAAEGLYEDGFLSVTDAAGEGISYHIAGHVAGASAGDMWVELSEPLQVALTTSSQVSLHSSFSGVIIAPANQADMPVGVPNVSVAAGAYAWVQTRGICAVWADEAVAKGSSLKAGSSVPGAVETQDADDTTATVGVASQALVDTEYRPAFLTIS